MISHLSEYCFAEEENHNTLGYFEEENITNNQVALEDNLWKVLLEFNAPGQKSNQQIKYTWVLRLIVLGNLSIAAIFSSGSAELISN